MARGTVHEIQAMIAFGYTYPEVQKWKDGASQTLGPSHRLVHHGWYRKFGRCWDFADPFPEAVKQRTQRICASTGPTRAEEYMVSVSHDYFDRIWDCEDLSREDRILTRKYWVAFHIWLVLNPDVLREWAGVDVLTGRIHRVIDGEEIWEEANEVKSEYKRLLDRAYLLLRCDKKLRHMVELYGGSAGDKFPIV